MTPGGGSSKRWDPQEVMIWAAPSLGFCWPVPCPALWRELMRCSKRRARIILHHLVASPNARDFAERNVMESLPDLRQTSSLRLDVGGPDHLAPFLGFL